MTLVGCFTNRYMLIPFFAKVMPIEAILSACAKVNPLIGSVDTYVLFGVHYHLPAVQTPFLLCERKYHRKKG